MESYVERCEQAMSDLLSSEEGIRLVVGSILAFEYIHDLEVYSFVEEKDPYVEGQLMFTDGTIRFILQYILGDETDSLLEKTVTKDEAYNIILFVLSNGGQISSLSK